mmetsp:Transcript_106343/g.167896  ORF Transcript_106343/g.167896 Transcript_106343/m.167896 type:complete len:164 (+) Transcript_106343:72-563(+)
MMHGFMCSLACLVSVAARSPLLDTDEVAQANDLATLLLMSQPGLPVRTNRNVKVATREPVMAAKRVAKKTAAKKAPAKKALGGFESITNSQRGLVFALGLLVGLGLFAGKDGVTLDPSGFGLVSAGCGIPAGFAWLIIRKSQRQGSASAYRDTAAEGAKPFSK